MNAKRTRCILYSASLIAVSSFAYGSSEDDKALGVSVAEKAVQKNPSRARVFKTPKVWYAFLDSKPRKDELILRFGTPASESKNPESVTFEVSIIKGEKPTRFTCFITDGRVTHTLLYDGDGGSRK